MSNMARKSRITAAFYESHHVSTARISRCSSQWTGSRWTTRAWWSCMHWCDDGGRNWVSTESWVLLIYAIMTFPLPLVIGTELAAELDLKLSSHDHVQFTWSSGHLISPLVWSLPLWFKIAFDPATWKHLSCTCLFLFAIDKVQKIHLLPHIMAQQLAVSRPTALITPSTSKVASKSVPAFLNKLYKLVFSLPSC